MKDQNGGYYAIKGFTYQFDKSLIEVLKNPSEFIEIEYIQDIAIKQFYIQIKYKETQTYSPSKIKPAIKQLLDQSINDKTSRLSLYCYFKDKNPEQIFLSESDLDQILGDDKDKYKEIDKKNFLESFSLEFSPNFQSQFKQLIKEIKNAFSLTTDEEAARYHAIFRANLLEIAIKKEPSQRKLNFQKLKNLLIRNEKIILDLAYYNYLKNKKYLDYLRKEYFVFKTINIPNKERLFVIDVDDFVTNSELINIINNIQSRYYKKETSPAPYIYFRNLKKERMLVLKHKLWDMKLFFADGTYFDGDKFRLSELIRENSRTRVKFIEKAEISGLIKKKIIDDTYVFKTSNATELPIQMKGAKEFYIKSTRDVIKLIK